LAPAANTATSEQSAETTIAETTIAETTIAETTIAETTVTAEADSDGSDLAAPPTVETDSATVVLGSPELTAGIPGEGSLTVAEIQAWLDQPENHVPLDIELPVGLSAGKALVQGIQENPMTRAKIELGRQLYFDTRLSSDNTVSCASCHHPDEGFGRHTQFGVGVAQQTGDRNSPISYNRILSGPQFWDGRADSLEAQAVGPIANPIEMGNTHEACVKALSGIEGYRVQFERIFPDEGLTIDTVGKAIATFERAIVTSPAPYDYYELVRSVNSQFDADEIADLEEEDPELYARYNEAVEKSVAMSESARRGRELFFAEKSNCTACHAGANFTDEKYHNLGVGMEKEEPDLGRYKVTMDEKDRGAFKTPTVRNVSLSAPYMHDGSQATLEEVVEWYAKGGHPNEFLSDKVKKLELSDQDKQDLVAFMVEGLTSDFPPIESGRLPE
jgi:cytochrome c peroxidase